MNVTVWTLTSDTNNGLITRVHASEAQAFGNFVQEWSNGEPDRPTTKLFDEAKTSNNFARLEAYLQEQIAAGSYDSFKVEAHQIDIPGTNQAARPRA